LVCSISFGDQVYLQKYTNVFALFGLHFSVKWQLLVIFSYQLKDVTPVGFKNIIQRDLLSENPHFAFNIQSLLKINHLSHLKEKTDGLVYPQIHFFHNYRYINIERFLNLADNLQGKKEKSRISSFSGAPGENRTQNLLIKSQAEICPCCIWGDFKSLP